MYLSTPPHPTNLQCEIHYNEDISLEVFRSWPSRKMPEHWMSHRQMTTTPQSSLKKKKREKGLRTLLKQNDLSFVF